MNVIKKVFLNKVKVLVFLYHISIFVCGAAEHTRKSLCCSFVRFSVATLKIKTDDMMS